MITIPIWSLVVGLLVTLLGYGLAFRFRRDAHTTLTYDTLDQLEERGMPWE